MGMTIAEKILAQGLGGSSGESWPIRHSEDRQVYGWR